jgi:hypothetical protein
MGLTIHYRLRSTVPDAEQARDVVGRLRKRALDLPFESVEGIVELTGDDCGIQRRDEACPYRWLLIQAQPLVTDPLESARHDHIIPLHVIAFSCWPGPGCEQGNFGLCRYPKVIEVGGQDNQVRRRIETRLHDWSWASFCKTEYARNRECGGARNFRRCHWAIVDVLQHAQTLGILHEVHDEAGYWASRQVLSQALGLACASA